MSPVSNEKSISVALGFGAVCGCVVGWPYPCVLRVGVLNWELYPGFVWAVGVLDDVHPMKRTAMKTSNIVGVSDVRFIRIT
jgi:hypothetical protein